MIVEIAKKVVGWQTPQETFRQQLVRKWSGNQTNATTYPEWLLASQQLDALVGNDEWKRTKETGLYFYTVVEARLGQLRQARLDGDIDALTGLVRTTLQRNLGNMGDEKLYSNCNTGTKLLIEEYITECETCLRYLLEQSREQTEFESANLLAALIQTRKAFGRTALVLSGGSTFGILHIGVIKELYDQSLLPRIVSGSSAGSIFASLLCIHKDEEMDDLLQLPLFTDFNIFEQTGKEESVMDRLARLLKYGTWFDNSHLSNTMRELLGDLTFQEAYFRTQRVLNVTVSSASVHEMPRLLNYLTAPNVLIWSAVCASCSVPLVFASYDIRAKNPKTDQHYSWNPSTFIDGSVDNDLPISRLSEMFNVNHFIACQVNPHIVPFIHLNHTIASFDKEDKDNTRWRDAWNSAQTIVRNEISHYLLMLSEVGLFKNTSSKLRSVLAQQYSGDITILPQLLLSEMPQLFRNPSRDFFSVARLRAAQATWPKMSVIRNHCAIELALDKAIHTLKARMLPETDTTVGPMSVSMSINCSSGQQQQTRTSLMMKRKRSQHYRRQSDGLVRRNNSWQANINNNGGFDFGPHARLLARAPHTSHPATRRSSVSSKTFIF